MLEPAAELTVADIVGTKFRRLVFAPLRREQLHAQAQSGVISMDPRSQTPLAKTLIHELLHMKRPLWSETRIRREESRLWNLATWQEKAELYKLLGKAQVWQGEEEFPEEEEEKCLDSSPA